MFDDKHLPFKEQVLFARQLQVHLFVSFFLKRLLLCFLTSFSILSIIHAAVAHFYVIFIEYLIVAMFAEMLFNQF